MFTVIICALMLSSTIDVVQSKFVYQPGDSHQFLQEKVIATWWEAKERCEKIGATLASPTDESILKFIRTHIALNNHSTPYFIGMKVAYNPEPTFVSVKGEALDDMPQSTLDLIDQLDPRDGSCLSIDSKGIRAVECWERLPYICYSNEVPSTIKPTTEETPGAKCTGTGYSYYPSVGCYKYHEERSSWDQANRTCTKEGAYLVILDDEKEANDIFRIFGNRYFQSFLWPWVGLFDEHLGGDWRTVKGDPIADKYNVWEWEAHQMEYFSFSSPFSVVLTDSAKLMKCPSSYPMPIICEKDV